MRHFGFLPFLGRAYKSSTPCGGLGPRATFQCFASTIKLKRGHHHVEAPAQLAPVGTLQRRASGRDVAAISLGCLQSFAGAKLHLDGDVMAEVVVPEL